MSSTTPQSSAATRAPLKLASATLSEADGVRYLHLGTPWVQGAMRLRRPNQIELEYVQRMMAWMLLREPDQLMSGHAVQLGMGAAAITRFCHSVLRMQTTVVELNPSVIAACRMWFRLPQQSGRLTVVEGDAGQWVADPALAGTVDALCVDVYDHDAAAPIADTVEFYRHCARLLGEGGAMTTNLFGRNASFHRSAQRIASVFGESHVRVLRPTREGNTIVLAWKGAELPAREALEDRACAIESRFGLPARKWLRIMQSLPLDALEPVE